MNFLMTDYIYPLSEKILLSEGLNLWLDNLRTEEEITAVSNYIAEAHTASHRIDLSDQEDEETKALIGLLEKIAADFCNCCSETDTYVEEFCRFSKHETVFEFIAKTWIVARYDDEGEINALREARRKFQEEGEAVVTILEDDHPILRNSNQLVEYSSLMSLLIHTQVGEYSGGSFILDPDTSQFGANNPSQRLPIELMMVPWFCEAQGTRLETDNLPWKFFPYVRHELATAAGLLDSAFKANLQEKLMYVANLLKTVEHDISDEKFKMVTLVSVIELLLTHSPDYNRFNVEDSISKQFQLKTDTLVYLDDQSRDLDYIARRLKTIGSLRSNISHGNFKAVQKYVDYLSKKDGEEEYFSDLLSDLYTYIRAVRIRILEKP